MSAPGAGDTPAEGGDGFTGILHEVHELAMDVGPGWGLILVIALCLFLPRIGVIVQLAKLFKEDRADARKRKLDSQRLLGRYRNRPQPPAKKK